MSNLYPGLLVAVMGMIIVFSILAIIMVILKVMEYFFYTLPNNKKQTKAPLLTPVRHAQPLPPVQARPQTDDGELVAAITAAVAVYMGKDASTFKIKSFTAVRTSEWNSAGRRENVYSRI